MKGFTPLVAALVMAAAGCGVTPAAAQMTGVPTPGYIASPGRFYELLRQLPARW